MNIWHQMKAWLPLSRRQAREADLARELRTHLELEAEEQAEAGLPSEEAHYAARRALGNTTQIKEDVRVTWGFQWLETLLQDIRYGLRQLRRNPGFTAVAVVTLALGIGATTAIFSVVNGVLLSPLPFPNPNRLVIIREASSEFPNMPVSYPNFRDWQRQQKSFSALAVYRQYGHSNLEEPSGAVVVSTSLVSANFFNILDIPPLIGRSFSPEDNHLGAGRTVILSYPFWQTRFGGDPAILGRSLNLDGKGYSVIGVLPKKFWFFHAEDIYVPEGIFNREWRTHREQRPGFSVVGRLKPGVTLAQAKGDLNTIEKRLDAEYSKIDSGLGIFAAPMRRYAVEDVARMLYLLLAAVCLLLLIACVNVANLLLSRSSAREKEMAIRAALGAGRTRVVRQLLTESILLAFLGGALGILLAGWGTRGLLAYVPQALPRAQNVGVDFRVLLFVLVVSVATGVLFGLAPAFHSSKNDLRDPLQEGSRGSTGGRRGLQNGLAAAEVGLALVLLVGAGLTLRTILNLYHAKTGFTTRGSLVLAVSLPAARYDSGAVDREFYRNATAGIANIPGVSAVGATTNMPMAGNDSNLPLYVEGRPKPQPQSMPVAMFYTSTPGYLRAMDISLLRGRFFTNQDTLQSQPVLVIDDEMSRKLFPGQNPIGQHVVIDFTGFEGPREIVGIVHHINHYGPVGAVSEKWVQTLDGAMYVPLAQLPGQTFKGTGTMNLTFVVRTSESPETLVPSIRRAIHRIDTSVAIRNVNTISDLVSLSLAGQRLTALLFGIFAALALILAAVGIYGVISYAVAQRTHEIGIRMALGAQKGSVLKMVVGQGMKLALIGVGAGLAVALALTRFLASFLYGVKPSDPLTFIAVSSLLTGVALLACYVPARRAARVDPMVALRHE